MGYKPDTAPGWEQWARLRKPLFDTVPEGFKLIGNHYPTCNTLGSVRSSPEQDQERDESLAARCIYGPPVDCESGTAAEMLERGYVGLYRPEDADWDERLKIVTELERGK